MEGVFSDSNIKIILFTTFISLMVSLMVYNGNIAYVARYLVRYARNRKSAQIMTWASGLIIFFDDYANAFIVGNTLKPITDRHRVAREKLAFIVDSTAAPVAAIALVSTWVGVEVKEIGNALGQHLVDSPYTYFLNSLRYSYYPVFTIAFVLITILTGREFGPMLKAKPVIPIAFASEFDGVLSRKKMFLSLLPMAVLLGVSILTMLVTGYFSVLEENWTIRDLVAGSDSINSLLVGSVFGLVSAHFYFSKNRFDNEYFKVIKAGASKISEPMMILMLAWFLGSVIKHLQIAQYILEIMPVDTTPFVLPAVIFLFSCLISFATGSSFSTMSIVYPMALPIVFDVCNTTGFSVAMNHEILYHSIACVIAGAVFGDHCSPISDTTVLSSIATECNHLDHVRTQMPYALVIGGVSFFISLTLANMQLPFLFVYGIGFLFLYLIVRVFGRTY